MAIQRDGGAQLPVRRSPRNRLLVYPEVLYCAQKALTSGTQAVSKKVRPVCAVMVVSGCVALRVCLAGAA